MHKIVTKTITFVRKEVFAHVKTATIIVVFVRKSFLTDAQNSNQNNCCEEYFCYECIEWRQENCLCEKDFSCR